VKVAQQALFSSTKIPFAIQFSFLLKRQFVALHLSGTLRVFFFDKSFAALNKLPFLMMMFSFALSGSKVSHSAVLLQILMAFARHELPVLCVQLHFLHLISI